MADRIDLINDARLSQKGIEMSFSDEVHEILADIEAAFSRLKAAIVGSPVLQQAANALEDDVAAAGAAVLQAVESKAAAAIAEGAAEIVAKIGGESVKD